MEEVTFLLRCMWWSSNLLSETSSFGSQSPCLACALLRFLLATVNINWKEWDKTQHIHRNIKDTLKNTEIQRDILPGCQHQIWKFLSFKRDTWLMVTRDAEAILMGHYTWGSAAVKILGPVPLPLPLPVNLLAHLLEAGSWRVLQAAHTTQLASSLDTEIDGFLLWTCSVPQ